MMVTKMMGFQNAIDQVAGGSGDAPEAVASDVPDVARVVTAAGLG
jgi:hypothetical protein